MNISGLSWNLVHPSFKFPLPVNFKVIHSTHGTLVHSKTKWFIKALLALCNKGLPLLAQWQQPATLRVWTPLANQIPWSNERHSFYPKKFPICTVCLPFFSAPFSFYSDCKRCYMSFLLLMTLIHTYLFYILVSVKPSLSNWKPFENVLMTAKAGVELVTQFMIDLLFHPRITFFYGGKYKMFIC